MTTTTTMDYLEALTNIMEWLMQEQEQDLPLDCKLKTDKNNNNKETNQTEKKHKLEDDILQHTRLSLHSNTVTIKIASLYKSVRHIL